ncbi:MAG: acyclic terpene utilization AtuA family protein [Rhodothermales bacterium]
MRLGSGAGYAGDRIEPAVELAEKGGIDYLVFECLAERTIALAQLARRRDPASGYDPLLERRMRAVLPACASRGIRIVTNAGAANPVAGAEAVRRVAAALGLGRLRIAAVTGDDVLQQLDLVQDLILETGEPLAVLGDRIVSANAYIGAAPIVEALAAGADVVVTGRAADPALFLAPLIHEFGWAMDDWAHLGRGTLAGHLLECAGQITGGYYADPGYDEVTDLARLGFPIGEVTPDGAIVITSVPESGGRVTEATCKQQLLYEIHDPARYATPDVLADFSQATVREIAPGRVQVDGASGRPRPDRLKASIGYHDGFIGEGQISYAGPGAEARGRLALEIVRERLRLTRVDVSETRFELIGIDALHGAERSAGFSPYEVRVRVAGRATQREAAERLANEVETLYTNGPAGGGGVAKSVREVIAVASTLIPRERVATAVHYLEV